MANNIDYEADRVCPLFNREIDSDLCFECVMALKKAVKVSSVPELEEITDIEKARTDCKNCLYSKF